MHHPENNLESDLSSTMKYRRDSKWGFFQYFCEFFFIGLVELVHYLYGKKRSPIMRRVIIGELSFLAFGIALSTLNFQAGLVVFWLPLFFSRLMMMAGNWAQHAFVDAQTPTTATGTALPASIAPTTKNALTMGTTLATTFVLADTGPKCPKTF